MRSMTLFVPLSLLALSACSENRPAGEDIPAATAVAPSSGLESQDPAQTQAAEAALREDAASGPAALASEAPALKDIERLAVEAEKAPMEPEAPAPEMDVDVLDGLDASTDLGGSDLGGISGLVGAKGSGASLGSRGSGLGGGGTAEGLGGLGTSGRGRGSASFGAKSEAAKESRAAAPADRVAHNVQVPAEQAQAGEGYKNYGVNDMTLVEKDRFSTFAVDVDTASYSITRRKLNEGMLPPQASVRVEEFVNAFDYGYRAPEQGSDAPFAVHMEAAPSPFEPNHHLVRVGVKGMEVTDRQPVHLTFLVDTSGSMQSADKLYLAQDAMMELVENLGPQDTVALATYAGDTRRVLEPTSASRASRINSAIRSLTAGGGTAMSNGMEVAYEMASESYVHGHENRVIVLSDGDANIGRTSHQEILATVQHHAEEGITLTTVGLGMGNYQDTMMEQLANKGDGNYFYVDSRKEASEIFGEKLSGTLVTIAKDVKIQVEFNPEAVIGYRLVGYENRDVADVDFRNDRVDAGEIGSGHSVTALYDVILADDVGEMELATVRLRAKKPGPDSAAKEWATVFSPDLLHAELGDASASFRLSVAVASFAELLRGSPYAAELRYSDVLSLAEGATLRGVEEHAELLGLIRKAARLSGDGGDQVLVTR